MLRSYRLLIPLCFLGYSVVYLSAIADPFLYALRGWALEGTSWADGSAPAAFSDGFARLAPYRWDAVNLAGYVRYRAYGELKDGAVAGRDGYLFAQADLIFEADVAERVAFGMEQIDQVASMLEEHGAELIFVPLPTKMDVERAHHDYLEAADAGAKAYGLVVQQARALGVTTVDARSAWSRAIVDGDITHRTDQHWTVHGASATAAAVAEAAQSSRGQGGISIAPVSETLLFQGDLSTFAGSETIASALGFPLEVIRPLLTSNAVESDEPPFILVGTSESIDSRWSFEPLLEYALQREIDNYAMSGEGPLYPMLQAIKQLGRENLHGRTFVWEFPVGAMFKDAEIEIDIDLY